MAVTDFIVAIELGSTKITGVAGKKNADGSIQILAYANEYSADCIKKGVIYNLDKTTQRLSSVIKQLESTLQASIKKVYVGMGGQSVRSIHHTEVKQLDEDTKISQALIDSMMKSNREIALPDKEILAVEPQEYKVGNNLTTEPVGIPSDHIEGRYLNIIARNTLKSSIEQCVRQAGYEVAEYLLSPSVTADIVLSSSEKRSGCALIDFGADTTTVAVYKSNILRHLAVIPLGSNAITKDICSLQIEEEDAEHLKLQYASAYTDTAEYEADPNKEFIIDGKYSIKARKLEDIVEARVKEILTNVWNQILLSGYSDKLLAGVIVTGGASNLPNFDKAFARLTHIEKIRIVPIGEVSLTGTVEIPKDGTHNTLLGLLYAGKENCCKIDPHGYQRTIFEDIEEQKRKAEEARKKAEEEERIRREKEAEEQRKREKLENCDNLIKEAKRLLGKKNYKSALAKAEEAKAIGLHERADGIGELIAEIKREKDDNNPFRIFMKKIKEGADDIMKD